MSRITVQIKDEKGISLLEVIIVIAIVLLLLGFTSLSLLNIRTSTAFSTSISPFVTNLKNQQIKSMVNDTEGRSSPDDYGVYIQSGSYTLFHGSAFNSSDPANFVVDVESGFQLSTTFPGNTITFATGSGEIINFNSSQNSVTITNTSTGQQKTLQINKYGVVTNLN